MLDFPDTPIPRMQSGIQPFRRREPTRRLGILGAAGIEMLSIIAVFHNMRREAARTLATLSPAGQRGIAEADYEVIAIDNGSREPLDTAAVEAHGPGFSHHIHHTASLSPAGAVNLGVARARGEHVAVIVDGARMVSPGIVAATLAALRGFDNGVVCTLAFHLGPEAQKDSMLKGYGREREDELLAATPWRQDGYRLFDISCLAPSSSNGFLNGLPSEATWIAMPRQLFLDLGGFDERFTSPGGGLVNQHFLNKALTHPDAKPVMLLGEATFHQFHGGVATNAPPDQRPHQMYHEEYAAIAGSPYSQPAPRSLHYVGTMPQPARRFVTDRTNGAVPA